MTTPLDFLPLATLVDQIAALCAQKQSGNLVLISDDNRMAQMHLLQGLIMFIVCRGRRGQDALPHMRTMAHARMSLDSTAVVRNEGIAFLPTSVLAYLRGTTQQLPEPTRIATEVQVARTVPPPPAPRPRPAPAPAPAPKKGFSPDVRHVVRAALVRYIGPMADIVCEEYFTTAPDLQGLVTALAAEIPNKDQSNAFKADIAGALGLSGF